MAKRPNHKTAHAVCPYGKANWADCDYAASHRWGKCRALVGKQDPEQCSNWALNEEGLCGQHYAREIEREAAAERIAIQRDAINARIDAYIEWTKLHPSVHDRRIDRKGLPFKIG